MATTPDLVLTKDQHTLDFRAEHIAAARVAPGAVIRFESGDSAHQHALERAWRHLTEERGLEPFEAYAYASARCEMRLGGPASPIVLAGLPESLD